MSNRGISTTFISATVELKIAYTGIFRLLTPPPPRKPLTISVLRQMLSIANHYSIVTKRLEVLFCIK